MSPDFRSRKSGGHPKVVDAALWLVVVLTVTASIYAAVSKTIAWHRVRASLQALRTEVTGNEARLRALQERFRHLDARLISQIVLTKDVPPERVLAALEKILPAGARLDGITLDYEEELGLTLLVVARRPEIYDLFLERLESSPVFKGVAFGAESREGEVRISVNAQYRGGGS